MKQWLGIFLLIWCTATLCASEGRASHPTTVEICTTILSSEEDNITPPSTIPLVATSLSTSVRMGGAELPTSTKGGRNTGSDTTTARAAEINHLPTANNLTRRHTLTPPSTHTAKRYIYFLRRITI